ncbi:hypothetical protein BRCON_0383 [Candidatus Sumerlaea chitinivorans]|uniref:Uncharacterized protein n=1 Tax=Sumerlaea chitinivorans TaxID=2250252 RepID=A0A2Z4Y236_SUMC1|nr:hypothetical protein BRCON_0383 [Candidatus Sumerlaea chitinivorans]
MSVAGEFLHIMTCSKPEAFGECKVCTSRITAMAPGTTKRRFRDEI